MQENYAQDRSNHKKQLFFADLTSRTTDANVKEYFSKYGQVTNVNLVTDRYTKVSKRYGFVTFQDDQDVDKVQKARDHVIDRKTIDTRRVFSADHNKQTCYTHRCKKNFIGGIADKSLTKEILKDYFVSLGFPEPASIEFRAPQVDKTGFAFIEFDDYDICDKLVIDNPHTVNNVQYVIKKGMKKSELVGQQNMGSQMGVNPGSLANGTMGG
ncbi:MAG: heteroproteinous nuclear ribonucleoprotein [Paramarteilia canceri]